MAKSRTASSLAPSSRARIIQVRDLVKVHNTGAGGFMAPKDIT
jgi:hypothetical protein